MAIHARSPEFRSFCHELVRRAFAHISLQRMRIRNRVLCQQPILYSARLIRRIYIVESDRRIRWSVLDRVPAERAVFGILVRAFASLEISETGSVILEWRAIYGASHQEYPAPLVMHHGMALRVEIRSVSAMGLVDLELMRDIELDLTTSSAIVLDHDLPQEYRLVVTDGI